ncbi:aminotransferase class I/II-fold pyridoxal phosphate-dependent enzyme [bacterium]|nr:MAG: aminotransferase class I/II-fold pyridoxal phosphate-dependent enzyme [bacterium]
MKREPLFFALLALAPFALGQNSASDRAAFQRAEIQGTEVQVKTIAAFRGVVANQIMGFGLVTGLAGTGDTKRFLQTQRATINLMRAAGLDVDPTQSESKNVALVTVIAELPAFSTPGGRIDVTVSTIGDSTSLRGGTLIFAPLKYPGKDETFATAAGSISVGGFSASAVINADVLDAWFPPAPGVVDILKVEAEWLARTSPPTHAEGLQETIANVRGLPRASVLTGAGSSDLIYRLLPRWLSPSSRVLLPEPCYGEYAHLIETVIGATVDRMPGLDGLVDEWQKKISSGEYDLAVLVNPNNPTGEIIERRDIYEAANGRTRLLVDEAYMDYVSPSRSVEKEAAVLPNLVVIKSLSKGLALSGCRVAYAVGRDLEPFRSWTPPWNVSSFAQVAAIWALTDPDYYNPRYRETHALRKKLAQGLRKMGAEVREGINWVLVRVPDAEAVVLRARERELYLRNAGRTAPTLGNEWIRIAVKDERTQARMLQIFQAALGP